jgi:hypothetical protein
MGWLATFAVAVLTAASCALASTFVANLAVRWYHVSTREGGAGYFVLAFGLMGFVAGFVIGLVGSRVVAAREGAGFFGAFGLCLGISLTLVGLVGGIARLQADVPPEVDGEELWLMLDVRLPQGAESPAKGTGEAKLNLGSLSGHTMRVSREGALFKEDAHLVDGRWVVPGAAEVFTTRGKLTFDVALGSVHEGFLLPISGRPRRSDFSWSPWYPTVQVQGMALSYRYKVQTRNEPFRTQTVGPFEVDTIAGGLYQGAYKGRSVLSATSLFRLRHRGTPVKLGSAEGDGERRFESADAVMVLPGSRPALLAHVWDDGSTSSCVLLEDEGGALRQTFVAKTSNGIAFDELTNDLERFRDAKTRETVRGWLDFKTLQHPAILRVGVSGILDTERLAVRRFEAKLPDGLAPAGMAPIAVSPGGKSFVQFAYAGGSEEKPVLLVTDTIKSRAEVLPIDRARMRYLSLEWLDPAWVDHHFAWTEADGSERLSERASFTPLPYHGTLSPPTDGYREYRLEAAETLRAALLDFLVKEMHGELLPVEPDAYKHSVRIDGKVVDVTKGDGSSYFTVSTDKGKEEGEVIAKVAKRFDAELATGKYDALFAR